MGFLHSSALALASFSSIQNLSKSVPFQPPTQIAGGVSHTVASHVPFELSQVSLSPSPFFPKISLSWPAATFQVYCDSLRHLERVGSPPDTFSEFLGDFLLSFGPPKSTRQNKPLNPQAHYLSHFHSNSFDEFLLLFFFSSFSFFQ